MNGMGDETWNRSRSLLETFMWMAVLQSQSIRGGSVDQVADTVARDIQNITDLYQARFERNYAVQGQAFGADPVIMGDLQLCGDIAETLQ